MDVLDERLCLQFLKGIPEHPLEGGVQLQEESVQTGDAEHVRGHAEKPVHVIHCSQSPTGERPHEGPSGTGADL